jgi:arylsulfatase A-like enzyme
VLRAVEGRPDASNTFVIFFSDNGGVVRVGDNAPWRGSKLTVYEGGTRVCAALRWPAGGLSGGQEFAGRIGYIDILPTVLAAAGASLPKDLDGIDLLPMLRGKARLPERSWFSYLHQDGEAHASVHDGQWKLVAHGSVFADETEPAPKLELYNLESDPGEQIDRAQEKPEIVKSLGRKLLEFGKLQRPGVGAYAEGREGFKAPKDWIVGE